jgi:quercetin dioxygenase-like cupin family protein
MSKAGDTIENPVTGERAVVRVGTEESEGQLVVSDLYVKPGGAVLGEHVHPVIEESFTVVRGQVGFRIDGRESIAELDKRLHVPAGTAHDWWNAGEEEAHVVVEISPARRFEEALLNSFGLAQDGKTNSKGMPNLLQLVLFAREFEDVLYFTTPPRAVQKILFGVLTPIARALGYRGSYPRYISLRSEGRGGAGPPSKTRIIMGTLAIACSLVVASLFLLGQARRSTGEG